MSTDPLAPIFEPLTDAHVRIAAPRLGDRVLDLACGAGVVSRHCVAAGVTSLVGADPDRDRMRAGRVATAELAFVGARAEALPFASESFSLVACQHGVMFFGDAAGAMREIGRILEPSGRTTLTAWCDAEQSVGLHCLNRALARVVGAAAERNSAVPFSMPDSNHVATLLRDAGFADVMCHPIEVDVTYPSAREFVLSFIRATSLAPIVAEAGNDAADRVADRVELDLDSGSGPFSFVARAYCVVGVRRSR